VTLDIHHDASAAVGLRKVCRIAVDLLPQGRIFVEDTQEDVHAVISQLADRASRAVGRELERGRGGEGGSI
jgi:hypothetical protein